MNSLAWLALYRSLTRHEPLALVNVGSLAPGIAVVKQFDQPRTDPGVAGVVGRIRLQHRAAIAGPP